MNILFCTSVILDIRLFITSCTFLILCLFVIVWTILLVTQQVRVVVGPAAPECDSGVGHPAVLLELHNVWVLSTDHLCKDVKMSKVCPYHVGLLAVPVWIPDDNQASSVSHSVIVDQPPFLGE